MIGAPVIQRELLSFSRRPRTYAFQTLFLGVLTVGLITWWPPVGVSSADVADRARSIFEYGGYLQLLLLAMLAPAFTASAITEEKRGNTLDLLLLTGTGPVAIVLGKYISRLGILLFLLFLTLPLNFALLSLGGISAGTLLKEVALLCSLAVLATALGVFLSTLATRPAGALLLCYTALGALLAAPYLLKSLGLLQGAVLTSSGVPIEPTVSPLWDMHYVFHPSRHVATESEPTYWWVFPTVSVAASVGLVLFAALLLPRARAINSRLSARRLLEALDFVLGYLFALKPRYRALLARARGQDPGEAIAKHVAKKEARPIGRGNPIYWKEVTVNTVARMKHWWRLNLILIVLMFGSYSVFRRLPPLSPGETNLLSDPMLHKLLVAVLGGLLVLLITVMAATTVSREREDGTLILLATTPMECGTYVAGKTLGILRNVSFLALVPFLHVVIFTAMGLLTPWSLVFLALSIPSALVAATLQGLLVSLMFRTTLKAIVAGIALIVFQFFLPAVCCLPQCNLPATCYYVIEGPGGFGGTATAAITLAIGFGLCVQVVYSFVLYSLIRGGFDQYIGRAG
ncbi:MAG: ABC transporter permease subunit [Planctomycetes bacterium]|nr:ABC transporter permease subunit [Planctomycetota bacterium]